MSGKFFTREDTKAGGGERQIRMALMQASGRGELPIGWPYYVGSGFGSQFALLQPPETQAMPAADKPLQGPTSDFASPGAAAGQRTVLQRRCPVTGALQGECEVNGAAVGAAGIFAMAQEDAPSVLSTPTGWTIKASADGRFAFLTPPGPTGAY